MFSIITISENFNIFIVKLQGGIGSQAVIHLGMHGTVEWLPGQPLGNDRQSWSDELLGSLQNVYCYAANNPSESILAKRRGYGTLVSYNVPPYGRAGLYLELANLKDLVDEYRSLSTGKEDLKSAIWSSCQRCGIDNDVPLQPSIMVDEKTTNSEQDMLSNVSEEEFNSWLLHLSEYLIELQDRLFSSGLHTLGSAPSDEELLSYLTAYFGDSLSEKDCQKAIDLYKDSMRRHDDLDIIAMIQDLFKNIFHSETQQPNNDINEASLNEAQEVVKLLSKNTEELDGVLCALDGGYVKPAPGGDLLRDGTSVLPTGRNIHALDPYRMPSAGAWARGEV